MTSTDHIVSGPPAWPGCALGAWAAAWLGGRCAPDDVTDTLDEFAGRHTVIDADDLLDGSGDNARLALLALLRRGGRIEVRLPTPGDPQGLPPDPATTAALAAAEIVLVHDRSDDTTIGLIPEFADQTCRWTARRYRQPVQTIPPQPLGQVEYDLREAVRETADIIGGLGSGAVRGSPKELRVTLNTLTARHHVTLPPHDDDRATRVLDSAARVEAIVDLAVAQTLTFGVTAVHVETGDSRLRRLTALARGARAAAVNQVIREYLPVDR